MAAKNVVKTAETLSAPEVMAEVLESFNPSDGGQDWVISEVSLDGAVNTAIFQLCQRLGLNTSDNSMMQLAIALLSYGALAEIGQHVLGIGSGIAKMDLTGESGETCQYQKICVQLKNNLPASIVYCNYFTLFLIFFALGFTLAQMNKKLDELVATVNKMIREPLNR